MILMNSRCVDLIYFPVPGGYPSITSFCFEASARAFALELGLTAYTISARGHVLVRCGA
jgi:hypothetical protein